MMRSTSLLLVAATVFAMLFSGVAAEAVYQRDLASAPSGEHLAKPVHNHIGTRSGQHLSKPAHNHIGTPSNEHLSKQPHHKIGTPGPVHFGSSPPHYIGTPEQQHLPATSQTAPVQARSRHHSKSSRQSTSNGKVTFYFGDQLLNPACPGAPTPTDTSMTAAISNASPFSCGDRIRISDKHGNHAVVTVVDRCAGCSADWIDVTKGVFRVFSSLDTGILHEMTFSKM